jgi:hypothetical protein
MIFGDASASTLAPNESSGKAETPPKENRTSGRVKPEVTGGEKKVERKVPKTFASKAESSDGGAEKVASEIERKAPKTLASKAESAAGGSKIAGNGFGGNERKASDMFPDRKKKAAPAKKGSALDFVQQMRKKTLLSPSPVAGKTREQVTIR